MLFDNPDLLSNEEIRKELLALGLDADLVGSIIDQFWFHDFYNSFISTPSHFNILKQFLQASAPSSFSRFDFYQYFFENTLDDYRSIRSSLYKLGMVFELMGKNEMIVPEFKDVLNQIDAPPSLNEKLITHKIISVSEKEGVRMVKTVHHTVTEFLAAEYILSHQNPIDEAHRLLIHSESGDEMFKPSLNGVLRFLIEQNPREFAKWIVDFMTLHPDSFIDTVAETIVYATSPDIDHKLQDHIFNLIFDHYQQKEFWIPVWAYKYLYKFVDEKSYQRLLTTKHTSNAYVYKGNIASIVDGMLEHTHPLITPKERVIWKAKLITFANEKNTNGVLNRHALAALANYKGEADVIQQVQKNATSPDSLVREAFINMCRVIDPNAPDSIDMFVKAITEETSQIYARHALYAIDTQEGILYFLQKISDDPKFIHAFLDDESIFNSKDEKSDKVLIDHIRTNLSAEILVLLKQLIYTAFTGERNYHAGASYFLLQITSLIKSQQPDYLEEVVQMIRSLTTDQKNTLFINDIEGVISVLLKPEEIERLCGVFTKDLHPHARFTLAEAVRLSPSTGNPQGEAVLREGVRLGITVDPKTYPKYEDHQREQDDKVYRQFQKHLSPPEKDQYHPQVFREYLDYKDKIEKRWTRPEKDRLLYLATINLEKTSPEKIKVRYKNKETKSGEYTISSVAGYFSDVLKVIHQLNPTLLKTAENRKKVVNFIPFAYSSDFKVIRDILDTITDEELAQLNTTMLDYDNDARYLVPATYVQFASTYPDLKSPKSVLMSFVADSKVSESDREYALRNLSSYLSPDDPKEKVFIRSYWNPDIRIPLSDTANAVLISVFHDKDAIEWRLEEIKKSAKPFTRPEGGHSVGELEMELNYMAFAGPIINLADERFIQQIIELLNFSLTLNKDPGFSEYRNYLWQIAIAFVMRENFYLSDFSFNQLRSWSTTHCHVANINLFINMLETAYAASRSERMKTNSVSQAIITLQNDT